jgi:glyoxylase-like metal-dependent hydrolase (beta-lactamase superfamily II)
MQATELRPNVFACLMDNETANAGFVVTERGVVVIDTFDSPARGRELAAAIRTWTDKPVLAVINTHYHYDHVFGNQAFDAPLVAHCALAGELAEAVARDLSPEDVAEWVSEHPEDHWLADELELVYPNIIFEHRLVLDLPPLLLIVRHLGGHTPDSSIVDLPDESILFTGDLIFEGRVPFLGCAHFGDTIKALHMLESLGDRTIVPGHGALCDTTYVTRCREYLQALHATVGELIARGLEKSAVLDSDQLPQWWTEDRPDTLRRNIERLYDELVSRA